MFQSLIGEAGSFHFVCGIFPPNDEVTHGPLLLVYNINIFICNQYMMTKLYNKQFFMPIVL